MPDPIFARTRYVYDSYSDFWRLVELSEFPTCFVDQMDLQSENTYIVPTINGELRPHVQHRRTLGPQTAKIIWWNLERPDSSHNDFGAGAVQHGMGALLDEILAYVTDVWVSDRHYATLDRRMRFVPMGSHELLAGASRLTHPQEYDVALMAAPVPRRDGVIAALKKAGLRVAPNAWGEERARILAGTSVMLNVHQHDNPLPISEPLRFALAASHRMTLVTEWIDDAWPLVAGSTHHVVLFEHVVENVATILAPINAQYAHDLGYLLHQVLCVNNNFGTFVREALR